MKHATATPTKKTAELLFPGMGTHVQLMVVGAGPALLQEGRRTIADFERRWCSVGPDSEVSRVNARAGQWTPVSADTFQLIQSAISAWRITDGRFHPTARSAGGAIEIDVLTGAVRVAPGVQLDLGGIAKAHAADLVVSALMANGASGALANLGGDVRVAGEAPVPPAWQIDVANPATGDDLATFAVTEGAIITSTRVVRSWLTGDVAQHELIDPATGMPATSGLISVTILAAQTVLAEVLAKAAYVAGPLVGAELATRFGATGMLVHESGAVTYLPKVGSFLV